jgi:5-formyltetrahydrofolate cyclo-ligase
MNKEQLRKALSAVRKRISESADKQAKDAMIFAKTIALPQFAAAGLVLCYVSTASEVDTSDIIAHSRKLGKTAGVPVIADGKMQFYRLTPDNELDLGHRLSLTDCTVCITPGIAFSEDGFRLGYGGGYYDRFLSENTVFSVGLCYRELITDVPTLPHDMPVDIVITEAKQELTG